MTKRAAKYSRRRRLWRWAWRLSLGLLVVLVGAFLAVKFWIGPRIVANIVEDFIGDYWNGPTRIEYIEIDFVGRPAIIARNVTICDTLDRAWIHIDRMVMRVKNWPSTRPVIYSVEIDSPTVTAYSDKGRFHLPLRQLLRETPKPTTQPATQPTTAPKAKKDDGWKLVDIESILIRNFHVDLVTTQQERAPAKPAFEAMNYIRIHGVAKVDGDFNLYFGEKMKAELTAQGHIELEKFEIVDLRALLHARPLENGHVEPLVLRDIKVVSLKAENNALSIPALSAKVDSGLVWGKDLTISADPGKPISCKTDFRVRNLPLKRFFDAYDPTQHVMFGNASAVVDDLAFSLEGIETLNMDAMLILDNSDLDQAHVFKQAYEKLKVEHHRINDGSDLQTLFIVRDGELCFFNGRVGNSLAALLIEPGGTVDLKKHEMNLQVTGGLLTDINRISVLGWFSRTGQALTRLRITGDWRKPKVRVEPLANIAEGAMTFFRSILETAGELPSPMDLHAISNGE